MVESISMSVYFSALALLLSANQSPSPYPPLDTVTGMDSMVERRSIELETSAGQWNSAWQRHKVGEKIGNSDSLNFPTAEKPPAVDFEHNEVLVLFGGLAPQGGYQIVESLKTSKSILVRIRALPTSLNGSSAPSGLNANPYLFAVYKKTKLPFDIQVERAGQDGTVQWQTVGSAGG